VRVRNDLSDLSELEAWKEQHLIAKAFALADSGQYHDFTDIDYALRCEYGWLQARAQLDDAAVRLMLNRRCSDALEAAAAVSTAVGAAAQAATAAVVAAVPLAAATEMTAEAGISESAAVVDAAAEPIVEHTSDLPSPRRLLDLRAWWRAQRNKSVHSGGLTSAGA
jgi:hypothetical protein